MKENYTYPIKLKKMPDVCLVTFPDFPGQMTEGESQEEAVWAARELLALCISSNEDRGIENPSPSEPGQIVTEEGEKLIYVHLWMPYFRQIQKTIYVKKTLTIPKWLDEMAKEKNVNFSAVLVKCLKSELGMDS